MNPGDYGREKNAMQEGKACWTYSFGKRAKFWSEIWISTMKYKIWHLSMHIDLFKYTYVYGTGTPTPITLEKKQSFEVKSEYNAIKKIWHLSMHTDLFKYTGVYGTGISHPPPIPFVHNPCQSRRQIIHSLLFNHTVQTCACPISAGKPNSQTIHSCLFY